MVHADMPLSLRYGNSEIDLDVPGSFDVIGGDLHATPLTDAEIGGRFDRPIGSERIEEIVSSGESVLIVVPDATRRTACDSIVNLLVRRLIANGTMPYEISIIFATGIHRQVTPDEKKSLLTPFIFQRIKTIDHSARDLMRSAGFDSDRFVSFGEIDGVPVELNREMSNFDHVVIIGGVNFHYFAGFTGGRKLICPGLASARTIAATHRLAFDFEIGSRRAGVGPGLLEGNAVHEAFERVAAQVSPSFSITAMVDDHGHATDVFCGHWIEAHRAACDRYSSDHRIRITEKREIVVVSCGGAPYDLNLIQAHKALDAAAAACLDGGTIILLAECSDGFGRSDFAKWFEASSSSGIAELLSEKYEVNGQTAWSLREKTERFNVRIMTGLPGEQVSRMGLKKIDLVPPLDSQRGYVMPFGSRFICTD